MQPHLRTDARGLPWWWVTLPACGVGALGIGAASVAPYTHAGLAWPVVAAGFALFVGAPLAREAWTDDTPETPSRGLESGFAEIAIWGSVAALATAGPTESREIAILAALASLSAFTLGRAARWTAALGLAAPLAVLVWSGMHAQLAPGWDLLEPRLVSPTTWLASAVTAGALLGWAPTFYDVAPSPTPGRSNLPFVPTGLGVLGFVLVAWGLAARYELHLGSPPTDVLPGLLGVLAVPALLAVRPTRPAKLTAAIGILVLALWSGVWGLQAVWWSLLCPVLLGAAAVVRAWRTRSALAVVAALVLLGSAGFGSPPYPETVKMGLVAMLPWIAAVWMGATRALLAREPA
ncbi:MAG: hypothetical protein H6734_00670 [Alphaproteobacteria bacterium]|nr:hypothetical protein [Alphaproteobacteria bacterium]